MSIAFTDFVKIKNNYCFAYYGLNPEYLIQLKIIKPYFLNLFPDLNLFICCRDDLLYLLDNENNVVPQSQIKEVKYKFSHIREISSNMQLPHPIKELIDECKTNLNFNFPSKNIETRNCLICPEGMPPTKPFSGINRIKSYVEQKGYKNKIIGSDLHYSCSINLRPTGKDKFLLLDGIDWVIGVENEYLFEAIYRGIKTTLLTTGIGTELYKMFLPNGEIINV